MLLRSYGRFSTDKVNANGFEIYFVDTILTNTTTTLDT